MSARVRKAERVLFKSAMAAQAQGMRIVCGTDLEYDERGVVGCCVTASLNLGPRDGIGMPDLSNEEWEAVEAGFDGVSGFASIGAKYDRPLYYVGKRLRAKFNPIDCGVQF